MRRIEDELSCTARTPKQRGLSSFSVFSAMSRVEVLPPVAGQAQDTLPNSKMLS